MAADQKYKPRVNRLCRTHCTELNVLHSGSLNNFIFIFFCRLRCVDFFDYQRILSDVTHHFGVSACQWFLRLHPLQRYTLLRSSSIASAYIRIVYHVVFDLFCSFVERYCFGQCLCPSSKGSFHHCLCTNRNSIHSATTDI